MAFGMQTHAHGMHHLPSGGFVWKSNTPLKLYLFFGLGNWIALTIFHVARQAGKGQEVGRLGEGQPPSETMAGNYSILNLD